LPGEGGVADVFGANRGFLAREKPFVSDFKRILFDASFRNFSAEIFLWDSQSIDQQALEDCEQLSHMIFKHIVSILLGFGIFKTGKLLAFTSVRCELFGSEKHPNSRCLKTPQAKCAPMHARRCVDILSADG
jgi:hypothetical protein